jgi:hypothetical protein
MLRRTLQWMALCFGVVGLAVPSQAQFRFSAEALFMDRDSDGSAPVVAGPDAFSSGGNYDPQAGFRFTLGGSFDNYDVEFIASQFDDWDLSDTGTLANPLVFDETANNPVVVAIPPANTLAYVNSLFDAATSVDELTESERLQAGATYFSESSSRLQDYQINFGSNPNKYLWRFQVGWRHMRLNENSAVGIRGTFDALDTDDAAQAGDLGDDPNNALADGSITGAGFALVSGTNNGFDAAALGGAVAPDTLTIYNSSGTSNILNGVQLSGGYSLFPESLVSVDLIGRAGLFHNYSQGHFSEALIGSGNDDSIYQRTFSDNRNGVAYSTSLGAQASVPVTDYISLSLGYEVNYIGNVALAPSQSEGIATSPLGARRYRLRTSDSILYHGLNAGLKVVW